MTNFDKKAAVDMLKKSTSVRKSIMAMRNRVVNITNDFNKSKVVFSKSAKRLQRFSWNHKDIIFNVC